MGVIYKFKKEVIDFVLHQKRENDGLSCRQLAVLTSEKFKLQVSKSSVNAIIKNAHLSSGVGRRPGFEPAPRKFQIPLRKKKQLSDEMRKVGFENKKQPVAPVSSQRPQVLVGGEPASGEAAFSEPRQRRARRESRRPTGPPVQQRAGAVSKTPQVIAQDSSEKALVERLRQERILQKGPVREGMGCVFLMAAQWELSRTSVLGKLLRKYVLPVCRQAGQQPPDFFDASCDILPCLGMLGVNNVDQIGQFSSHALWAFFPPSVLVGDIVETFRGLDQIVYPRRLFLEYEEEKKQLSVQASEFRVLLEDGNEVVMDALLAGVWPRKVSPWFSAPVEQAMSALSHCVVSSNRPAIFLSSGKEQFHQGVWEIIAAWEGLANKRFKKLDVLSSSGFPPKGEPLATFSFFPNKKRIFMLGVWPWQKEFTALSKDAGELEPFYCEELDQVVYVRGWLISPKEKENIFQGQLKGAGPFRAVAVSMSSPTATEAVIFTNWVQGAVQDVAGAFLRRWPYLDKGPAGRALVHVADGETQSGGGRDAPASPESGSPPLQGEQACLSGRPAGLFALFRDLGEALHQYCQKRFWGVLPTKNDITFSDQTCYKIPGCCSSGKDWLTVFLKPPAGYERLSELRFAAQRLNESAVADPRGRQLFVVIE